MSKTAHFLAVRGRFVQAPLLFTVPCMPLIGVLLAGGNPRTVWQGLLPVCVSAVFSTMFAFPGDSLEGTEEISPAAKKTVRIVSAILALLFASVRPETFTTVLIALIIGTFSSAAARINFLCAGCRALHYVFLLASGMALLPLCGVRTFLPLADLFAAGIFFYVYGAELAGLYHAHRPVERPGGFPLILGACAGYLTVFFRMGKLHFHGFLSYIPGILTAVFAGIFLILAWKAWQTFRKKSLPGISARWAKAMRENLLFIEAAAAAASGSWKIALVIFILSILARITEVRINTELDHEE